MCTVSWLHTERGYRLFCNRDERRDRKPGLAFRQLRIRGVRILAPEDGQSGGSWIAANQHGLTVCLLNGTTLGLPSQTHNLPPARDGYRSRGMLLLDLSVARSHQELFELAARTSFTKYLPCTIVALQPGSPASLIDWNGTQKRAVLAADRHMPLISSGFDTAGVRQARRNELRRLQALQGKLDEETLRAFHASHEPAGPEGNAYSVCMHRSDAATVSFTSVAVEANEITVEYRLGAHCEHNSSPDRDATKIIAA